MSRLLAPIILLTVCSGLASVTGQVLAGTVLALIAGALFWLGFIRFLWTGR